jgi:hypothetical protein
MSSINLSEIADHILFHLGGHIGRDRAIKRDKLLDDIRASIPGLTDRSMRKAIETCCPWVCSGATGYYFPESEAEVQKAVRYLDKKIYGLADRKRAILTHYPEISGQCRLGI